MSDSNPDALFGHVASQLNRFDLAYLHIIEPRIKGNVAIAEGLHPVASGRLRKIFHGTIVAAGGFEPETAETIVKSGDATWWRSDGTFCRTPICPSASGRGCR